VTANPGRSSQEQHAGGVIARSALFERLGGPARVVLVSAPPGSGKTVLLRSWITRAGRTQDTAWVPGGSVERDPRRFWMSVLAALRRTAPGGGLVQPVTAAPDLDGWAMVERLLEDLVPLRDRLLLVVDDVHELAPDAARQLELLVLRAPPALRFVLAGRHDVQLGLHRLRLEGELAEIRWADLRFTLAEARELFAAAGRPELPEATVALLHKRTEGWAAGLRLAALSLAGHPDPERFAAEFSGIERTVAEYLLAEVLDRQDEEVRRLLLRTSIVERVNGELADLLTGGNGGERVLQDLEQAGAFVASLDPSRSWFGYHRLFAELLRLELRRAAPDQVAGLHHTASTWLAGHGYPLEAIRHAQAAQDWRLAARLLADHWPGLHLDGQDATIHNVLARFPAEMRAADAELAVLIAADELAHGSLEKAERYLGLAERGTAAIPGGRRGHMHLLLGVVRLLVARQRGNLPGVAEQARRLQAMAEVNAADPALSQDLRALALISLGDAEFWAVQLDQAGRHLEQGVALARQIGRPFLELTGLACQAMVEIFQSYPRATERGMQAIELARCHGWTEAPAAGIAYVALGVVLAWQGRLQEAETWLERAERTLKAEAQPAAGLAIHCVRGTLELAHGHHAEALAAYRAAAQLAGRLAALHQLVATMRAFVLEILVHFGKTELAEQELAGFDGHDRDSADVTIALAGLRLAQGNPDAALAALAPVLDGTAPVTWPTWLTEAFLVEAIAWDALGDESAAGEALERALDEAEPNGVVLWFLLRPVPGLLARHSRHGTSHAALIAEILSLLTGQAGSPPPAGPRPPAGPLSDSEIRVLRYLPTNLTAPEIAGELSQRVCQARYAPPRRSGRACPHPGPPRPLRPPAPTLTSRRRTRVAPAGGELGGLSRATTRRSVQVALLAGSPARKSSPMTTPITASAGA
jgi:LuxR family maltose regulon positive regulatory protein